MGEDPTETVNEIEETRRRLDRELDELESRLPGRRWLGRAARIALGGGLGGVLFWAAVRKVGTSRRSVADHTAELTPVTLQVIPDRWAEVIESDSAKKIALAVAATWIAFKLVEVGRRR